MSRYIATRAIRGANALVSEAEMMLHKALTEKGPDAKVAFPNTAYYLPLTLGMTGMEISTLGQLQLVLSQARQLLHPVPSNKHWTPYLGETLDSGMATLLAAETLEAIRFVYGLQPEPMEGFKLAGGTSFQVRLDDLRGLPELHPAPLLVQPAVRVNGQTVTLPVRLDSMQALTAAGPDGIRFWPGGMQPSQPVEASAAVLMLQPGENRITFSADTTAGYPGDINVLLYRMWPME